MFEKMYNFVAALRVNKVVYDELVEKIGDFIGIVWRDAWEHGYEKGKSEQKGDNLS